MISLNSITAMKLPMVLWFLALMFFCVGLLMISKDLIILLEWDLIPMMSTPIKMTMILDTISLLYAAVVLFISANVMMFSMSYMKEDQFINRFTILVFLFIMSMNMLIFIPHFMALLLGWDGLGITSFILVIYYQNPKSLSAGMITALTNRIGDVMILLAIALTLNQGHWQMNMMDNLSPNLIMQVTAIMLAAMTKSAQMPFSSWLPAAMAAPTPVSALVHSSTLVTAGVFLLIRFYPFLENMYMFKPILLFIAVCTMIMAGLSATTECDMKKIIALSTLSQLGMMMTTLGLGLPMLAFFHMVVHAMFKALLFICAGSLITSHSHSQDLRWMGNLIHMKPVASSCILISNSALCGIPFMAGFYSKDLIMEWMILEPINHLMMMLAYLAIGLTTFYSIRLSMVVIWSSRLSQPMFNHNEPQMNMIPMLIMSSISIMGGAILLWLLPFNISNPYPLNSLMKIMPLMMIIMGLTISWLISTKKMKKSYTMKTPMLHFASCYMWFLVPMSSQFQLKMPMSISHNLLKLVDHSWMEMMGPQGIYNWSSYHSNNVIYLSSGSPSNLMLSSFTASTMAVLIMMLY